MGKMIIEDVEIKINERNVVKEEEHIIDEGKYVNRAVVIREFESSIYSYSENEKVLISQISRFGELYYKVVIFHDGSKKAWNLVELPTDLEVRVRRMSEENFVITADNKGNEKIQSQVSFCKLKPSTKVEEITISFTKLNEVRFIKGEDGDFILVYYTDNLDERICHTLALYNASGKCEQTLYEYFEGGDVSYSYEVIDNEQIKVIKTEQEPEYEDEQENSPEAIPQVPNTEPKTEKQAKRKITQKEPPEVMQELDSQVEPTPKPQLKQEVEPQAEQQSEPKIIQEELPEVKQKSESQVEPAPEWQAEQSEENF